MPALYTIILDNYPDTWGNRKSGSMSELERFIATSMLWGRKGPWKCKDFTTSSAFGTSTRYIGLSLHAMKIKRRQLLWDSKRLSRKSGKSDDTLNAFRIRKKLNAKVSSRGRKGSSRYARQLESQSDNTLFVEAGLDDQSQLHAAIWFEQTLNGWQINAQSTVVIDTPENVDALKPFFGGDLARSLDDGLRGLRFASQARYVESTVASEARDDQGPTLVGNHYCLPFEFGQNLQAAVETSMPLELICENPDSGRWRSTPFALQFAELRMVHCVLQVSIRIIEEVSYSTCYLVGLGLDNRVYYTQLADDNGSLRWNLYLDEALRFTAPSGYAAYSDDAPAVADLEDAFYLNSEKAFPPLGELASFDPFMGDETWRSEAVTSSLYGALSSPQLLHLQFGISLSSHAVTDISLTFRGTPVLADSLPGFTFERSLFRVAVGQPFNPGLRRIHHESQLRMMAMDHECEGYLEVEDEAAVINMRPTNDFHIPSFAATLKVELPFSLLHPVDQFMLRYRLSDGAWQMFATNDHDFQLDPPREGK